MGKLVVGERLTAWQKLVVRWCVEASVHQEVLRIGPYGSFMMQCLAVCFFPFFGEDGADERMSGGG